MMLRYMDNLLDIVKENEYIHCPTLEEALEYCEIANYQGLTWCVGTSYGDPKWIEYRENTIYSPHRGKFGSIQQVNRDMSIISYKDLKNKLES